ncbi:MAG: hypothetical protein MUC67_07100 [Acidobacteria bacterium]|jgi:hypothetical protein|nr:hypothetical protein [Acidobacteriota bacterium]
MSMSAKTVVLAFALLCVGTIGSAWAQAPSSPAKAPAPPAAAPVDEEELLDEKIREFGYWSGAALNCVAEAKQVEVERKVLDTFNGIARLFGTDRAFFYAAAFGRGTSMQIEPEKCPEFLEKFQKATVLRGEK